MGKLSLLVKAVATAGKIVDFALEHREASLDFLENNFTKDVTEHLRDKKIIVSEKAIFSELKKREEDERWIFQTVKCFADRMEITVAGELFGVNAAVLVALHIQSMTMNEQKQQVVFSVLREELAGSNLLGRIVCGLASCFSGNFCRKAINLSAWKEHTSFAEDGREITVDLSGVPVIEKMKSKQIPLWEDSVPLRLVGIQNARHEEGGIVLQLTVAEKIERLIETIGTFKDGVRNALRKEEDN